MTSERRPLSPLHRSRSIASRGDRLTTLKVGYVSSDWGDHPLSRVFGPVLRLHSSLVERHVVALREDDGSAELDEYTIEYQFDSTFSDRSNPREKNQICARLDGTHNDATLPLKPPFRGLTGHLGASIQ